MIPTEKYKLLRDVMILASGVVIAFWIARSGLVVELLNSGSMGELWGSLIAGAFFTSLFTVVPATVVLGQIAVANSVVVVAIFGGLGALFGDFLIFYFIRDYIVEDILNLIGHSGRLRFKHVMHFWQFRWLSALLDALIIASPLPDELGLALLGFSKTKTLLFIPFSFLANAIGIALVGIVARML